ncbi:hypothetical protein [Sulfitobacter sp. EhC04]|uniref:hypothetical protein n=1 Tax=Sulfitobacter sp. EhC04 TaxID=1849168 RepID=UPI0008366800|nr:hypothetical protein [Sulfitobacter sp. EhC04]
MDIILGLSAASVTVLMFCWAYSAHRRAIPARWTLLPGLSMLTCVVLTMLGPLSLGLFVRAALAPGRVIETFNLEAAVVALVLMALAVFIGPALFRRAQRSAPPTAQNLNAVPSAGGMRTAA